MTVNKAPQPSPEDLGQMSLLDIRAGRAQGALFGPDFEPSTDAVAKAELIPDERTRDLLIDQFNAVQTEIRSRHRDLAPRSPYIGVNPAVVHRLIKDRKQSTGQRVRAPKNKDQTPKRSGLTMRQRLVADEAPKDQQKPR